MLGAIVGDIVGSIYEFENIKTTEFPLFSPSCSFTDDTVLTVALAESLLTGEPYGEVMKAYYRRYPDAGYGGMFIRWAESAESRPYQSWGNGAAMRISPVGYVAATLEEVLALAKECTAITHDHPEAIKGGQAVAAAVFLCRKGIGREELREYVSREFGYDLSRTCDQIRPAYRFDISCQGTVPQALTAFLESSDFERAIRLAVSLGGDTDTLACITGGMAGAFYGGVPKPIAEQARSYLDPPLLAVVDEFARRYPL